MNRFPNLYPKIFSDPILDEEVKTKQKLLYDDITYKRANRYQSALKDWMKDFATEPLPFKFQIEMKIQNLESETNLPPFMVEKLNMYKNKLQSGEYCEDNNAHALYRGSYEDRQLAFVWPTQEENELRQQEESELLAQINK